jgi:alpha-beta hydrolase superfamily lysophospholipase
MTATLSTRDGLGLHLRHWPCTPAAGTVLVVHGLGEHGGRHAPLAARLNAWGWHVAAHDHRGHGNSAGPRGRLQQDDDLLHDLATAIDHVRAARPGPLVLLGHSMGGLVAARFVAGGLGVPPRWYREVDALVLSSPALDLGLGPIARLMLGLLGRVAPDLAVGNGLKPEWLSHDAAVVRAYLDDPLVHDRVSARLVRFMDEGGRLVRGLAPRWRLPTLLMYAGADRCVSPAGSRAFAAAVPRHVLGVREFAPLFHEIFNEPEREQVFDMLRSWLDATGAAAPATS